MGEVTVLAEPSWLFVDSDPATLYELPKAEGISYARKVYVDPFPCYPHDAVRSESVLRICERAYPLPEGTSPNVYLLSHEFRSRVNGTALHERRYGEEGVSDETQRSFQGTIVLSGKRIPAHPAHTAYLIAHEYGHVVEDWLKRTRHESEGSTDLLSEYADARRLSDRYLRAEGGHWHDAVQEIFACDFRVLVTGVEGAWWPHPGVARPEERSLVVDYWERVTTERKLASLVGTGQERGQMVVAVDGQPVWMPDSGSPPESDSTGVSSGEGGR